MPAYTFYHPELNQETINLEKDEFKHLKMVMRQKKGDQIQLIDGKGKVALATIETIEKNMARLSVTSITTIQKPAMKVALGIAHIRPQKFDQMLEQIVAIGVDEVYTFPMERSDKQADFSINQKLRHQHIIINSCKQSLQPFFPKIHYLRNIKDLPKVKRLLCDPNAKQTFMKELQKNALQDLQILIGPESGFTKKELLELTKDATPVLLSKNIFRAELAAISAVMIAKHFLLSTKS